MNNNEALKPYSEIEKDEFEQRWGRRIRITDPTKPKYIPTQFGPPDYTRTYKDMTIQELDFLIRASTRVLRNINIEGADRLKLETNIKEASVALEEKLK